MAPAANTAPTTQPERLAASYRKLADVFHDVLSERGLPQLLDRLTTTLGELVPCDGVVVYTADEQRRELVAVHAVGHEHEAVLADEPLPFGHGLTGWAIEHGSPVLTNRADLDRRALTVGGTDPAAPEALIVVPLISHGVVRGALNVSRLGTIGFTTEEFELVARVGDAAAIAIDNAETRSSLELQARTDALTGVLNTRALQERLRAELERSPGGPTALVMIDVDEFKRVNDVFGHLLGDEVLVEIATAVRETLRTGDDVGRLGGDELAIVAPVADRAAALALARRVADRVQRLRLDPIGEVSISLGVAVAPDDATTARELLACAESAMMTAKSDEKRGVVAFGDGAVARRAGASRSRAESHMNLRALYGLSTKLMQLGTATEIAETVVGRLDSLVEHDACGVYVHEGSDLRLLATRGRLGPERDGEHELVLPLRRASGVEGVLVVRSARAEPFSPVEVRLLESLAVHVAAALALTSRGAARPPDRAES